MRVSGDSIAILKASEREMMKIQNIVEHVECMDFYSNDETIYVFVVLTAILISI